MNKLDLLVSFDTTGSMYPVLSTVRQEVEKLVHSMFAEIKDLRLGIIAHGDYCDKDNPYTIKEMEFTKDEVKIADFVKHVKQTYGGDSDECYELVLKCAYDTMQWRKDAQRVFIMIGDASPHAPSYPSNKEHLDWVEEAQKLADQGIKVFAVHALSYYRSSSKNFYKKVASITGGMYLTLDQFSDINELIKATAIQQFGGEEKLNDYITIIKDSGKMTRSLDANIRRLLGEEVEDVYEPIRSTSRSYTHSTRREAGEIKKMAELEPVAPGRFQVMTVDKDCDIKGFVTSNGIEFKKGRGFYELTKVETVQQYKEIIMQDRETGEMFVGSQVREKLGLKPQTESGGVDEKLYAKDAKEFRIFVQSTSVNRKLIGGTTFLYEISDIADTGTVIDDTPVETKKVEKKAPIKEVEIRAEDKKPASKKTKAKVEVEDAPKVEKKAPAKKETKPVEKKVEAKKTAKKAETKKVDTKKAEKKASTKKAEPKTEEVNFSKISTKGFKKPKIDKSMAKDRGYVDNELAHLIKCESDEIQTRVEKCNKSMSINNVQKLKSQLNELIKTAEEMLGKLK